MLRWWQTMESVTFTTDAPARLEGELRMPDGPPLGSAVLCHPHPRHGGSKDHPLLWAIRNDLAATRHLAVLAFNFRGVMGSGGTYGGGSLTVRGLPPPHPPTPEPPPAGQPAAVPGRAVRCNLTRRRHVVGPAA